MAAISKQLMLTKARSFLKSTSVGEWLAIGVVCLIVVVYLVTLISAPGVEARATADCLRAFPQFTQEQCAFLVQHHVMVLP
jgi:hypothetical protein